MAKQRYALEEKGPKRLEVSWKGGNWREFVLELDGQEIGRLPGKKELQAGQSFTLSDGSVMSVKLVRKSFSTRLEILRNGMPLPGSATDSSQQHKTAYGIVFFIAVLNILLGGASVLFQSEFLRSIGLGIGSLLFGVAFLVLGFFVWRRSAIALILAIALFALDGLLAVVLAIQYGGSPGIGGIVVRVLLILPMIEGVGAIRMLNKQSEMAV